MKKPRLYIIHGWTYTVEPWTQTIELLRKKGIDVHMLQVPGLTSPSAKVWTIEDYVKWADSMIPQGAVALGHSNGGRILLNLCSHKPDKLRHLILLDAAGIYEESTRRDVSRVVSKKLKFLKKIPGVEKVWHKLLGASDYDRAPANMKETLSNMLTSDQYLDFAKIQVPASILWGEQDTVTPVRQAQAMHERLPGSQLKIFPGWNHAPYILHPEELAEAIYQVYFHPPDKAIKRAADTAAVSAAFALKKAPEPVLRASAPANVVAPSVATKLVLRKDEKITEGLVASDEEGAAVRYRVKETIVPTKKTDVGQMSASATLKKAKVEVVPDIDTVAASASASLRKEGKSQAVVLRPAAKQRAVMETASEVPKPAVVIREESSLTTSTPVSTLVPQVPEGAITSASVAKVGKLEKARRKMRGMGKKSSNPQKGEQ